MSLTIETFDEIKVGDIVEAEGLFRGVTAAPVKLRASQRNADAITFVATYLGVTLGAWTCNKDLEGVKIQWSF